MQNIIKMQTCAIFKPQSVHLALKIYYPPGTRKQVWERSNILTDSAYVVGIKPPPHENTYFDEPR